MVTYKVSSHLVYPIEEFRTFVEFLDGVEYELFKKLSHQVWEATGTPQEPRDWRRPSRWIPQLRADGSLDDETSDLASRLDKAGFNARHWTYEIARIAVRHDFIDNSSGTCRMTDRGRRFAQRDMEATDAYLVENGIMAVLGFLYEETGPTKDGLVSKWREWINREGGRKVESRGVLWEGVRSRIDNVLIPLGYARKEGVPRRYFITENGTHKVEEQRVIDTGDEGLSRHDIAVESLLDIGAGLGYQARRDPTLRDMLPAGRQPSVTGAVYNKKLDVLWKTNLPLVGEIRIPIEVQAKGSITDLLSRLKIVAPYSHYMIVASDEKQINQVDEYIKAQGEEKIFKDKIIFLTFDEVSDIRSHVTGISSKLKPAYGEEDET